MKDNGIVYIKEAWATEAKYNHLKPRDIPPDAPIWYANDGVGEWPINLSIGKLRSPLFMPAWAARYFIKILDVRPERLQDITEEDAIAEGFLDSADCADIRITGRIWYQRLWDSINPKYPWSSNLFVWRIEFERVNRENRERT